MKLTTRKDILCVLGNELKDILNSSDSHNFPGYDKIYQHNPWFTEEFVKISIKTWADLLQFENIETWLQKYPVKTETVDKTLGIIMAGNIPMVGMHDLICGFACGLKMRIKLSSKDNILLQWVIDRLNINSREFSYSIEVTDALLKNLDAIIATGGNNSNRYFEYYFSSVPNILRKNRNSVAVLNGDETEIELDLLTDDMLLYFGLGCRNVSKIYVPIDYDFEKLSKASAKYNNLSLCFKYANNLDYQLAVLSMNRTPFINTGSIFMVESKSFSAPVAVLNYEFYQNREKVFNELEKKHEELQCVVTKFDNIANGIMYGQTQYPKLDDYADNIDTIKFLTEL
jgi:hypothetical protein